MQELLFGIGYSTVGYSIFFEHVEVKYKSEY
jgi:hypothetical protein